MSLNPQQQAAVEHVNGPLLILAGAGSGKTRVITHRVGHLIDAGVAPEHILAVSFTNKAAGEMRERVAQIVGKRVARRCHLSTFHAMGAELLRKYIDRLGFRKPFTILDTADQLKVLRDVIEQAGYDVAEVAPKDVLGVVSRAKNAFCQPKELKSMRFNPVVVYAERLFEPYMEACRALNAVDFDDLQTLPVKLFEEHPDVLAEVRNTFRYIMVDEYQDTNDTQLLVLRQLAAPHYNLCVVGDDDQAIYSFRGAVTRNILNFEKHFPGARVIKLQQNYRSTATILKAANAVVRHNKERRDKALWSALGDGERIEYYELDDEVEEAEFVVSTIERQGRQDGIPWSEFAILMRTTRTAQLFEESLQANDVPYRLVGGTKFFDKREVKDLISYLRVLTNPYDEVAVRRIINTPTRGIGPRTLSRLSDHALARSQPMARVIAYPEAVPGLGRSHVGSLRTLNNLLTRYREAFASSADFEKTFEAMVADLKFKDYVRASEKSEKVARIRLENIAQMGRSLARCQASGGTLESFVQRAMLADNQNNEGEEAETDEVTIMTLHASKGLEYPRVFLIGFEEGLLPHSRSLEVGGDGDVEEERRLVYVGITRAKEKLYLTSARTRGRGPAKKRRTPSRYLEEIPEEFIQISRHGEHVPEVRNNRKFRLQQIMDMLEG